MTKSNKKKYAGIAITTAVVAQAVTPIAALAAENTTSPSQTDEALVKLDLGMEQEQDVDIVLTLGNSQVDATSFEADLRKLLTERGIDNDRVNITSVEAVEQNVFQGKFAMNIFWPNNGADIDTYVLFGDKDFNLLGQVYFGNLEYFGSTLDTDDRVGGVGEWATINFDTLPSDVEFIEFDVHAYAGSSLTNLRLARTIDGVQEFVIDTQQMIDNNAALTYFGSLQRNATGGWDFVYTDGTRFSGTKVTINSKDFAEVIRQPEWRGTAEHFLVNLDDTNNASFDDPNSSGEILTRLLNEDINYIGWGTDTNKAQANNFISRNNDNGTFIDNTNYDQSVEKIADYIADQLDSNVQVVDADHPYVIAGQPIRFKTTADGSATEEFPNGLWKFEHDATYFDNDEGTSALDGVYKSTLPRTLDKPGMYEVSYGEEHPNPQYIYAHRKPIADFGMQYTKNADGTVNITPISTSFDPDHQTEDGKGIAQEVWRWKETTATEWNEGTLPSNLPAGKHYVLQLQVQDVEGAWSTPMTTYITTDPTVASTPIANFTLSSERLDIAEKLVINNASYDPTGKDLTISKWTVTKDGKEIYTGATPLTDFSQFGVGNYTIKLSVTNSAGTVSEEFSRLVIVVEKQFEKVTNTLDKITDDGGIGQALSAFDLEKYVQELEDEIDKIIDTDNRKKATAELEKLNKYLAALKVVEQAEESAKDLSTVDKINEVKGQVTTARSLVSPVEDADLKSNLNKRLDSIDSLLTNGEASLLEGRVVEVETGAKNIKTNDDLESVKTLLNTVRSEVKAVNDSPKKTELLDRLTAAESDLDNAIGSILESRVVEVEDATTKLSTQEKIDAATALLEEVRGEVTSVQVSPKKQELLDRLTAAEEKIKQAAENKVRGEVVDTDSGKKDAVNITWTPGEQQEQEETTKTIDYKIVVKKFDPETGEFNKETFDRTAKTQEVDVQGLSEGKYLFEIYERVNGVVTSDEPIGSLVLEVPPAEVIEALKVQNVKAVEVDSTTATISWDKFSEGTKRYTVQAYAKDPLTGEFVKEGYARSTTSTTLTINTLSADKTYKFEVTPYEGKLLPESASFSNEVKIVEEQKVEEELPVTNPINVELDGTTANVSWGEMEDVTRYRVQMYVKTSTGTFEKSGTAKAIAETSYKFTGLKEGNEYKFVVEPRVGFVYDATKAFFTTVHVPTTQVEEPTAPAESTTPTGEEGTETPTTPTVQDGITGAKVDMKGSKATISWDPTTIEGKDITSFKIVRYVKDEITGKYVADGLSRSVTGTSYEDTYKLKSGKTYKYEITPRVGTTYNAKYKIEITDVVNK